MGRYKAVFDYGRLHDSVRQNRDASILRRALSGACIQRYAAVAFFRQLNG